MQVRPELQIKTAIKAMTQVVIPALDPNDQLAQEQAALTVGMLALLAQHLPLEYRYERDELERLLSFAGDLRGCSPQGSAFEGPLDALAAAVDVGADLLDRARAEPAELSNAILALRSASAAIVDAIFADGNEADQSAAEDLVLSMSREQLLRDRAWLLMQQWEPEPESLPDVSSILAPVPGRQR